MSVIKNSAINWVNDLDKVDSGGRQVLMKKQAQILVVDDDKNILELLKGLLGLSGYCCTTAPDAETALNLLKITRFSVMLTDVAMPGMNGIELTRKASLAHPEMPIIVMTGFVDKYTSDESIKAGAADFIAKPFSITEIKARIERLAQRL
ncbi:MAG: hypothetical protein A2511_14725 [Deltaproteobacteria bacterium RIFOXYD12_FULL_50_9]|nr:MAG: hypothetical protein A2511_14725 [Deltaproteobacteria bacterium RIFOXYD12_FULL_50_9]